MGAYYDLLNLLMRINLNELAKLLLIYIIGIVLLLFMWSCNPLKKAENKVLANVESVQRVRAATDPLFPCANDSLVFIHDSTTVTETVFERDTLIESRNDTTFVNYFDTAIVTKTVTITKEITVLDGRELDKLNDSLTSIRLRESRQQGTLYQMAFEQNKMQGERNLWRIAAIILFAVIVLAAIIKLLNAFKILK